MPITFLEAWSALVNRDKKFINENFDEMVEIRNKNAELKYSNVHKVLSVCEPQKGDVLIDGNILMVEMFAKNEYFFHKLLKSDRHKDAVIKMLLEQDKKGSSPMHHGAFSCEEFALELFEFIERNNLLPPKQLSFEEGDPQNFPNGYDTNKKYALRLKNIYGRPIIAFALQEGNYNIAMKLLPYEWNMIDGVKGRNMVHIFMEGIFTDAICLTETRFIRTPDGKFYNEELNEMKFNIDGDIIEEAKPTKQEKEEEKNEANKIITEKSNDEEEEKIEKNNDENVTDNDEIDSCYDNDYDDDDDDDDDDYDESDDEEYYYNENEERLEYEKFRKLKKLVKIKYGSDGYSKTIVEQFTKLNDYITEDSVKEILAVETKRLDSIKESNQQKKKNIFNKLTKGFKDSKQDPIVYPEYIYVSSCKIKNFDLKNVVKFFLDFWQFIWSLTLGGAMTYLGDRYGFRFYEVISQYHSYLCKILFSLKAGLSVVVGLDYLDKVEKIKKDPRIIDTINSDETVVSSLIKLHKTATIISQLCANLVEKKAYGNIKESKLRVPILFLSLMEFKLYYTDNIGKYIANDEVNSVVTNLGQCVGRIANMNYKDSLYTFEVARSIYFLYSLLKQPKELKITTPDVLVSSMKYMDGEVTDSPLLIIPQLKELYEKIAYNFNGEENKQFIFHLSFRF